MWLVKKIYNSFSNYFFMVKPICRLPYKHCQTDRSDPCLRHTSVTYHNCRNRWLKMFWNSLLTLGVKKHNKPSVFKANISEHSHSFFFYDVRRNMFVVIPNMLAKMWYLKQKQMYIVQDLNTQTNKKNQNKKIGTFSSIFIFTFEQNRKHKNDIWWLLKWNAWRWYIIGNVWQRRLWFCFSFDHFFLFLFLNARFEWLSFVWNM